MIEGEKKERPHDGKMSHTTENKLDQLLKDLEEQWDSIEQSKRRALRRYSTDSSIIGETFQLMDNSPRSLMSTLQQRWSPDETAWKVRNNDLAVMEILRERRAAIESGKLKGRRLFQEPTEGERESLCSSGWNGLNQDSEMRSVCSYDSDDDEEGIIGGSHEEELLPVSSDRYSYSSSNSTWHCEIAERQEVDEGEKILLALEEENVSVGGIKWMGGLRWIVVVLTACAVLCTITIRSFLGYKHEDEKKFGEHCNACRLIPTIAEVSELQGSIRRPKMF